MINENEVRKIVKYIVKRAMLDDNSELAKWYQNAQSKIKNTLDQSKLQSLLDENPELAKWYQNAQSKIKNTLDQSKLQSLLDENPELAKWYQNAQSKIKNTLNHDKPQTLFDSEKVKKMINEIRYNKLNKLKQWLLSVKARFDNQD